MPAAESTEVRSNQVKEREKYRVLRSQILTRVQLHETRDVWREREYRKRRKNTALEKKAKQREQKQGELEEEHRGKRCLQREPGVSTHDPAVTYHQQ